MSHGEARLRVQMPHGGASERVQMTKLWNKKTIIAHKIMYFYRICNSTNRFLRAKTATFSRTVQVKYLHMLEWNYMLLLKSYIPSCFCNAQPPDLFWQMPHRGEGESKKMSGGMGELGIDRAIM